MSRKPESRFKDSVHRHLDKKVVHRQSMSSIFSNGTPDEYYEGNKGCIWIEYKYSETLSPMIKMSAANGKPKLSALQQEWLARAYLNGINVCVILGWKDGGVIFRNMGWEKEFQRETIQEIMKSRKELAAWITQQTCGKK